MRIVSSLVVAACVSGAAYAECESGVSVDVERLGAHEWRISYAFEQEFSQWEFLRSGDDYRTGSWIVETDGVSIVRRDNVDYLIAEEATSSVTLRINSEGHPVLLDNQGFLTLGGSAMAIYSGQLQLRALCRESEVGDDGDGDGARSEPPHHFRFGSQLEDSIRVDGQLADRNAFYRFNESIGAYALYGATPADNASAYQVYVADSLPARMPGVVTNALARSLGSLAGSLEHDLETPPVLILAQRTDVGDGVAFRGGVLDNQVAIEVGGGLVFSDDPEIMSQVDRFVARLMTHEAVHLWNGDLVTNADSSEAWMHEGSAELLSWYSLYQTGFVDQAYLEGRVSNALNQCLDELRRGPLVTALERGRYSAYYTCGVVMNLRAGHAVNPSDPVQGVFQLWASLIRSTLAGDDTLYTTADFYRVLAELGAGPEVVQWLEMLREESVEDLDSALPDALSHSGWNVERTEDGFRVRLQNTP